MEREMVHLFMARIDLMPIMLTRLSDTLSRPLALLLVSLINHPLVNFVSGISGWPMEG